jgi:hypothetical protein
MQESPIEITPRQLEAAAKINECYQKLSQINSNVVCELISHQGNLDEWQHYPPQDIKDKRNHCQYYYHSHPSEDGERIKEHGHFHIFLNEAAMLKHALPIAVSDKYTKSAGQKDALCHLIGIAMNEQGIPTALFTANHWVVHGLWYKAEDLIEVIDNFCIDIKDSPFVITNTWVTNMIHLFKPQIELLLQHRDVIVTQYAKTCSFAHALLDKQLEITSLLRLQAYP